MRELSSEFDIKDLDIYDLWEPGANIDRVCELVEQDEYQIRHYVPDLCLAHLGHNDLASHPIKNAHPEWHKTSMDCYIRLAIRLLSLVPTMKVILSAPWPRVLSKHNGPEVVYKYNKAAAKMLQYLKSRVRIYTSSGGKGIAVVGTPELWVSRRSERGFEAYFEYKDGLHLNEWGRRLIATKWLKLIQKPESETPPSAPEPTRKTVKKRPRGGRKVQEAKRRAKEEGEQSPN